MKSKVRVPRRANLQPGAISNRSRRKLFRSPPLTGLELQDLLFVADRRYAYRLALAIHPIERLG